MRFRLVPLIVAATCATLAAQAPSTPRLAHSTARTGAPLVIVAEGLSPGAAAWLHLAEAHLAPPSLIEALHSTTHGQALGPLPPNAVHAGRLSSLWRADEHGRITLSVPLLDPADARRPIVSLSVQEVGGPQSEALRLVVHPPLLVLPGRAGLLRVDLRTGELLQPALPGAGGLQGAALSDDGLRAWVLREQGALETWSAWSWGPEPLERRVLPEHSDTLGGSARPFVLTRPVGAPFAPAGSLRLIDRDAAPIALEALSAAVAGRRVAVSADGETAFVAEDDLLVREVDLRGARVGALISAGMAGDRQIVDLLLDERMVLVASRPGDGRPGTLTVWRVDHGTVQVLALAVEPERLVALGEGRVLVVPAGGARAQLVERGLPTAVFAAQGRVFDAAPGPGGLPALLVAARAGGTRVELHDPRGGRPQVLPFVAPPTTRIFGAGGEVLLLAGDPSGALHVVHAAAGTIAALDAGAAPDGPFAELR